MRVRMMRAHGDGRGWGEQQRHLTGMRRTMRCAGEEQCKTTRSSNGLGVYGSQHGPLTLDNHISHTHVVLMAIVPNPGSSKQFSEGEGGGHRS
eukprot:7447165-Pyramimonas_sp.AAC.1